MTVMQFDSVYLDETGKFLTYDASNLVGLMQQRLLNLASTDTTLSPETIDGDILTVPVVRLSTIEKPVLNEIVEKRFTPPTIDDSPTISSLPDTPSINFNYTEAEYIRKLNSLMEDYITDSFSSDGVGVDIEAGVWTRESVRSQQIYEESRARVLLSDFALPLGVAEGIQRDLEKKLEAAQSESERVQIVTGAKLFYSYIAKRLDIANVFNGIQRTFDTSVRDRLLDAAQVAPDLAMKLFRAELEGINALSSQFNAIANRYNAIAKIYRSDVEAIAARDAGMVRKSIDEAEINTAETNEQMNRALYDVRLARTKDEMALYLTELQSQMKIISDQILSQIAASATTATSISASLNGRAVYRYETSYRDSYQSQHVKETEQ